MSKHNGQVQVWMSSKLREDINNDRRLVKGRLETQDEVIRRWKRGEKRTTQ